MKKKLICAAASLAIAACISAVAPVPQAEAAVATDAKVVATTGSWVTSSSKVYYKVGGKAVTGLASIGSNTYYFDSMGVQRTGWRLTGGTYYYFTIANGASGSMASSKIVNGVKLNSKGAAILSNTTVVAELKTMAAAQKVVDSVSSPTDSKDTKLRACFNYLTSSKVTERVLHDWTSSTGWHRMFANHVFEKKAGDCNSIGCAMAYLGNACGATKSECVASGGHGWARIDGKYYDPEWSRHSKYTYFAVPGRYAEMNYESNCRYVVNLSRTSLWKGKKLGSGTSTLRGLVKKNGAKYYYTSSGKMAKKKWVTVKGKKYYFDKDGKAVTKSAKIKGTYYVFKTTGALCTGSKTRLVKVAGSYYRVTKSGKAKKGWNAGKTKYYQPTGMMCKGICLVSGKLTAFSSSGKYNKTKTAQLRTAATNINDATVLLALMGTPKSIKKLDSCDQQLDAEGVAHEGVQVDYTYANVKISTFLADDSSFEHIICIL